MKFKVLKPLRYALDGVNVVDHAEGDEIEVKDRHVKALKAAEFIGDLQSKPEKAAPDKPEADTDAAAKASAKAAGDAAKGK